MLFLVGPLLWVIALAVVGRVVRQLNVIEIGLLAAALSCAISIVLLLPMRVRRAREERASGEHAPLTEIMVGFVALRPVVTAAAWIAGGLILRAPA